MADGGERKGKSISSKDILSAKSIISKIEKLLNTRNKKIAAIIFIIGILLMTLPGKTENKKDFAHSDEEERLCSILTQIQGCGRVDVMITYSEEKDYNRSQVKAKGAIIVAQGADDVGVSIKLSQAAQAVLDLPAHKVRVYKSME